MAGRVFEPVLTVTDDILYDSLPPEYDHLRPAHRPAESAEAPAPSEEPMHSNQEEFILDPHDVEGVQFFKKGHKHGTQMKKIRKLAKPQTVVALLYRFKVRNSHHSSIFSCRCSRSVLPTGLSLQSRALSLKAVGLSVLGKVHPRARPAAWASSVRGSVEMWRAGVHKLRPVRNPKPEFCRGLPSGSRQHCAHTG